MPPPQGFQFFEGQRTIENNTEQLPTIIVVSSYYFFGHISDKSGSSPVEDPLVEEYIVSINIPDNFSNLYKLLPGPILAMNSTMWITLNNILH